MMTLDAGGGRYMKTLLMMALMMAVGLDASALAQPSGQEGTQKGGAKEPALPVAPLPADVHTPLCIYHNVYYSKGATICIGTGWAQICQPDGGWSQIAADPRTFSNACGDAKSVPPE